MLGFNKLKELVKEKNIVENLPESEFEKEGGIAFDLRIGEIYELIGSGHMGLNERKTPDTKLIGKFDENKITQIILEPGKYYVIKTIETINCPKDLAFVMIPRSTLYRSGIQILCGVGDPGYSGQCTYGLINLGPKLFTIELGTRIVNIMFYNIDGDAKLYKGNYLGGNIGTDKI
ncbi:MAG: hypothetical protein K0B02_03810 [DPANN group archaeon]|nr:hypothetical protein [DPANN group archaeon]